MSLLDEILQGLPVNSLLREKITQLNADKAAAETQNAILRDDLNEAKAENRNLQKQIEELTHKEDLDKTELDLLVRIGQIDYDHAVASVFQLNFFKDLSLERVKYHLERLSQFGYIRGGVIGRLGTQYAVTQTGRKLLLDKNLL